MQSSLNIEQLIPESLTQTAYQAFQQGKALFGLAHKNMSNRLTRLFVPNWEKIGQPLSKEEFDQLQQGRIQLLETDWKDAQEGVYPTSLLFENPWNEFFLYYPAVLLDLPLSWQKIRDREYQNFSSQVEQDGYPNYYLQNFHYQTDGYLSDWSANLYDLQVELLFNGTADPMRRRILKPLKKGLNAFSDVLPKQIRVLDVACGTGRSLKMIRTVFPKVSLFGADLSPAYLRKANQLLSETPEELPQLVQANGEELPYQDNYFHALTSVFLFHELPPQARQNVIEECFRVTKPGGIFIICDSIQAIDSPQFQTSMDNFPKMFHEPYYKHYTTDNLVERLEKAGFENIDVENHFMSKYWVAHKPV
ncbi:Methyltransferase type 11 [Gloeothece citriformis PCC 7424]|uniref:Methyltransferase type 11 n=1 Tax=Gloeothece citriformis (strain PCC 7424) TaxID=65393 RepID=B7KGF6_GLOC7|nr:class I SAM-dependent methyltransferase [Gloeothece citriformis]ACK70627.1 Methyltransferase type 11 [Gloeothece citriformis PCC 7424]